MKSIRLTLTIIAAAVGALVASAQQAPVEAVLSEFSGDVTVTAPGATVATPAVIGQKLPEGSTVNTAVGAIALIESHQGISTGLGESATAVVGTHSVNAEGVRTAEIDLKVGSTVSVLDPSKRKINNYGVRTPKGVAAARGTLYVTSVKKASGGSFTVTVDTVTGAVSFGKLVVLAGTTANDDSTQASPLGMVEGKPGLKFMLELALTITSAIAEKYPNDTNAADALSKVKEQAKKSGLTDAEIDAAAGNLKITEASASGDAQKKLEVTAKRSTLDLTISPSQ
jgi:hypothetical protein